MDEFGCLHLMIFLILFAFSINSVKKCTFSFSRLALNFLSWVICSFKTSSTFSLFCIKIGTHMDAALFAKRTVLSKPPPDSSKMALFFFFFFKHRIRQCKRSDMRNMAHICSMDVMAFRIHIHDIHPEFAINIFHDSDGFSI